LRLAGTMQGLSSESVAMILVVGVVLGIFPVYGGPTILCFLAAAALRVNPAALQLVNQLATPLQLASVLPLARLGERILGSPTASSAGVLSRFHTFTVQAIAGWLCISLPLGLLLYFALTYVLRRGRRRWFNEVESPA
jgi:uncharacterized protein (DUF2062 family)